MSKEKMYGGKVIRTSYMYVVRLIVQACVVGLCIGGMLCSSENNSGVKIEGEILNGEM